MIKNCIRSLIVILLAMLLIAGIAIPALAFEERSGVTVTIGSGEVINSDLYVAATNVTIDGTINGDVFGIGQTINVNGTVNGGITLAGQRVNVNGNVSAGARIAGQSITIGGNIGRDLIIASVDATINQTAVIGGDMNLYASTGIINGHIAGNLRGTVDSLTINGRIDRDVVVEVNTLTLNSATAISGNLTYTSGNEAVIQSGATVSGSTNRIPSSEFQVNQAQRVFNSIAWGIGWRIYSFLAAFIIGIVFIFTIMRRIKKLSLSLWYHPWQCLGWGALIFFVAPIAIFIVMLTVIGIPLAMISLVIWFILLYLAQIPVAITIGWLILSRNRDISSHGLLVGALALGLFLLYLISAIPIVGGIIWFFVILFGLGTLVTVFRAANGNYRIAATT